MFKHSHAVLKLAAIFCAVLFFSTFSTSIAQVSSPQNLNVSVEESKAMLSWDAPEEGTAAKFYIYKAYGTDENADPETLKFVKSDSTTDASYSDDLSSISSSTPVAFYYVTAVDENGSESSPSNSVNAALPKNDEEGEN